MHPNFQMQLPGRAVLARHVPLPLLLPGARALPARPRHRDGKSDLSSVIQKTTWFYDFRVNLDHQSL